MLAGNLVFLLPLPTHKGLSVQPHEGEGFLEAYPTRSLSTSTISGHTHKGQQGHRPSHSPCTEPRKGCRREEYM